MCPPTKYRTQVHAQRTAHSSDLSRISSNIITYSNIVGGNNSRVGGGLWVVELWCGGCWWLPFYIQLLCVIPFYRRHHYALIHFEFRSMPTVATRDQPTLNSGRTAVRKHGRLTKPPIEHYYSCFVSYLAEGERVCLI